MKGVEARPGYLIEDPPVLPAWFQCRVVRECGGEIEVTDRTGWNFYVRDIQGACSGAVAVVAVDCDTEQTSGYCRDTKGDRAERVPARVAARCEGGRRPPVAARRKAADLPGPDAPARFAIEALVAAELFGGVLRLAEHRHLDDPLYRPPLNAAGSEISIVIYAPSIDRRRNLVLGWGTRGPEVQRFAQGPEYDPVPGAAGNNRPRRGCKGVLRKLTGAGEVAWHGQGVQMGAREPVGVPVQAGAHFRNNNITT